MVSNTSFSGLCSMDIRDYSDFIESCKRSKFSAWAEALVPQIETALNVETNGNLAGWEETLDALPSPTALHCDHEAGYVRIGEGEFSGREAAQLRGLKPWRKGPWQLGGITIDTEWQSDWKWERVAPHLSDLTGRTILDVGSGNGYFCYRMALAGAKRAIGIDPGVLSVMQWRAMKRFTPEVPAWVLPVGIEAMPEQMTAFDTIFSMGVLYHRKSPIDHLIHLRNLLRHGGELVLETIVVDESYGELLVPEDRYAQMRNVWFLPSVAMLERWLRRCGFRDIRTVDVSMTTVGEQRKTDWTGEQSLENYLSADQSETVEGYPAPKRAVVIATRP